MDWDEISAIGDGDDGHALSIDNGGGKKCTGENDDAMSIGTYFTAQGCTPMNWTPITRNDGNIAMSICSYQTAKDPAPMDWTPITSEEDDDVAISICSYQTDEGCALMDRSSSSAVTAGDMARLTKVFNKMSV